MSESNVHPTAIIGPEVELDSSVKVGPYAVLQGRVQVDADTVIDSHAHIGSEHGRVRIGKKNWILSGACVGGAPQDLSFKGESTELVLGDSNVVREFVTLNVGTEKGGGLTKIGSHNLFMAYVHVGHDCVIHNNVVMANSIQLSGHVEIDDYVRIGGMVGITQFTRLGRYSYIGGGSTVNKDIPPFCIAQGNWATARVTNKIGLERSGFISDDISKINKALRYLIRGDDTVEAALEKIQKDCLPSENVQHLIDFINSSDKGIAR